MTVEKNIGYGLKNMKVPADEIKKKVDWAIDAKVESRIIVVTRPGLNGKRLGSLQMRNSLAASWIVSNESIFIFIYLL